MKNAGSDGNTIAECDATCGEKAIDKVKAQDEMKAEDDLWVKVVSQR